MRGVGVWLGILLLAAVAWLSLGSPVAGQAERLLLVAPGEVTFLAEAGQDDQSVSMVRLASTSDTIQWTAVVSPSVAWLSVSPAQGSAPPVETGSSELGLYMQSNRLPQGTYFAQVVVTADETVINSPVIVPVTLIVAPELRRLYLPLISQATTLK
jgi:hypothetical protein